MSTTSISQTCAVCGKTDIGLLFDKDFGNNDPSRVNKCFLGVQCKNCGAYVCVKCKAWKNVATCPKCGQPFTFDKKLLSTGRTLDELTNPSQVNIPHHEEIVDFWPDRCFICENTTTNPVKFVVYTAASSTKVQHVGFRTDRYTTSYSEFQEHPIRICDTCAQTNKIRSKAILWGSVVIGGAFVGCRMITVNKDLDANTIFAFLLALGVIYVIAYFVKDYLFGEYKKAMQKAAKLRNRDGGERYKSLGISEYESLKKMNQKST